MRIARILSIVVICLLSSMMVIAQTKKPQPKPKPKAPAATAAKPKPAAKPKKAQQIAKPPGYSMTRNGLPYKIIRGNDSSRRVNFGDVVDMHYVVMKNPDSIFVSSYIPRNKTIRVMVNHPTYKGCVYEGLSLLNVGDSGVFLVNVDSLFMKTFRQPPSVIPPFVKRGSTVMVSVRIYSALSQLEMAEEKQKEIQKKRDDEYFNIEAYLTRHAIVPKQTPSGLRILKTVTNPGGKPIESGDSVFVHYTGRFLNDTVFEDSHGGEPFALRVERNETIKGWDEALMMMHEGEKATLVIPFDLAYGVEGMQPGMPPFATLVFDIEVLRVSSGTKAVPYNTAGKDTITTRTGIRYIIVEKGTGPAAAMGKKVKVHYTGYFLANSKVFDSSIERNAPYEITIGKGEVIPGWEEILSLMQTGDKVRAIIPPHLAYGIQGREPVIPANSTLVFDIELLDVQ